MPHVELENDTELIAITKGVDVDKIPSTEIETLNKILELYKNRWNKEFDANVGAGLKKSTKSQDCFSNFINQRVGLHGQDLSLRIEIVESESNSKTLKKFVDNKEAVLLSDGLFEVAVMSVDLFYSSVANRPFAVLPGARSKMEIAGSSDRAILLDPNDILTIEFVTPNKTVSQ